MAPVTVQQHQATEFDRLPSERRWTVKRKERNWQRTAQDCDGERDRLRGRVERARAKVASAPRLEKIMTDKHRALVELEQQCDKARGEFIAAERAYRSVADGGRSEESVARKECMSFDHPELAALRLSLQDFEARIRNNGFPNQAHLDAVQAARARLQEIKADPFADVYAECGSIRDRLRAVLRGES